ncbi:CHAT domain-containing protein [Rhodomicrobium vannielii]|nr:CHAT domain-containing tetratricopeptide repeat protein [Rhodomicrobium vannielii]
MALALAFTFARPPVARAEEDAAPPRTITDITAVLDREKPNPDAIAKFKLTADGEPAAGVNGAALAYFYYDRSMARQELGRYHDAKVDADKAVELARGSLELPRQIKLRFYQGVLHRWAGNRRKALEHFQVLARDVNRKGVRGWQFSVFRHIAELNIALGDLDQAETYLGRSQSLLAEARGWDTFPTRRRRWESSNAQTRASILFAKGRYLEAEKAFAQAELLRRQDLKYRLDDEDPEPVQQLLHHINSLVIQQAKCKARNGRLAEAEVDARRALMDHLKTNGKYSLWTQTYSRALAGVLLQQGRYDEAEHLLRSTLEIQNVMGFRSDASVVINTKAELVAVLSFQRRWKEAAALYDELEDGIKEWTPVARQRFELNTDRIYLLYQIDQVERGIAAAQSLIERETKRVGETHFDTAVARGILAIGLMRAGREGPALAEFRAAVPPLLAAPQEHDYDDTTWVAARNDQLQLIVEAYLTLLARRGAGADVAAETFPLADAVRSQAVHKALAAAGTRMVIKDPALAALARDDQDLEKEVNANLAMYNDLLAIPSDQRDEKIVKQTRERIEKLRASKLKSRQMLAQRFPTYADLLQPKPPGIAEVQAALKPGEALVSIYAGRETSFAWAVPKSGPAAFAVVPLSANAIEDKVKALRVALAPNASMISEIPPFDLALAHEVYRALLQPVEAGWRPAKTVFVVTNGALGSLPLGVLPVRAAEVDENIEPHFAAYRNVAWLARTHALVALPSAAALRTLRSLPPGEPSRAPLIGFGDPIFSPAQATAADAAAISTAAAPETTARGVPLRRRALVEQVGVDSADLGQLPPLPDTAEELLAIAQALRQDPAVAVKLGRDANERAVKNADLSRYRIVAFSTHGLVAGELNGLTQPALALTAPQVAGVDGDGLLTMEEILALRLNADWVILSACNTGTGIGAGAEAASGLGRAFFYAGSRALLVTNWSVHSESARELVTDIFRRQADDPGLSRAEALRQSTMALLDGSGYVRGGKTLFAYAHPWFWAPYTIIGDGAASAARN